MLSGTPSRGCASVAPSSSANNRQPPHVVGCPLLNKAADGSRIRAAAGAGGVRNSPVHGAQQWTSLNSHCSRGARHACRAEGNGAEAVAAATAPAPGTVEEAREQVLDALRRIIDPDFGEDVVACGFIKDLQAEPGSGQVSFRMELTTPACPIKGEFERQAREYVGSLPWVSDLEVVMDARPTTPLMPEADRPQGLRKVKHIIAVSSCKGGVGKSTVSVNLAYTLAQMGARVGIFDADVYGPSLPTMVSPETRVLIMDPETKAITPTEYEGVKVVSFGFAGQGSAIMRGPMVSGVITQLLTTTDWGELDYLVVDFPPGTGDIQLTLCQTVGFSAAVIVTTPQKLAFIDVAKGIRMFARLMVPCVAVVENMSYFEADGKRHFPFGQGSGDRIQRDFGLPNLVRLPIVPDLSEAGDGGRPLVVSDPTGGTSSAFMELGAAVVREVAKMGDGRAGPRTGSVRYDEELRLLVVRPPNSSEDWYLEPEVVRANDTSAASIDEWTGERLRPQWPEEGLDPQSTSVLGNYAVQVLWEDGFNQVAPFDLLSGLDKVDPLEVSARAAERALDAVAAT